MPAWNLDWFGPDVVYGLLAAAVLCGLVIWWAAQVSKDIKW
jgi:hypothetical protein